MKRALAIAVVLVFSSSAHADSLVAGWDFSPFVSGFLSLDGATFDGNAFSGNPDALRANYSELDPNGLGAEAGAFGTMYLNGQFDSFDTPLDGSDPFRPQGSDLLSNNTQSPAFMGSASAFNILTNEGQGQTNQLSMRATGSSLLDVVFGADLATAPAAQALGSNWQISFAANTLSDSSSIGVFFSETGVSGSYNLIQNVQIDTNDTAYMVDVGGTGLSSAFFKLAIQGDATIDPGIDNVAIRADLAPIPEPGTALLCLAGMAGLGLFGRRRG